MSCINTNDSEFKELLVETNLSAIVLAARIKSWQEANSTEEFPVASQVLAMDSTDENKIINGDVTELEDSEAEEIFEETETNVEEEVEKIKEERTGMETPDFTNLTSHANWLANKSKDTMRQVFNKARASKLKTGSEKRKYLTILEKKINAITELEEAHRWKVILGYTKAFNAAVTGLTDSFKLQDKSAANVINMIKNYEEYLASYDLRDDVTDLLTAARNTDETLSEEDLEDIAEINRIIKEQGDDYEKLKKDFEYHSRKQALAILSDPKYNTKVEADHRIRLGKEYKKLKITGETVMEYTARMMNTRDKQFLADELLRMAKDLANNPTNDISKMALSLFDPLNTNSRLIEIVTNIINAGRERIIAKFTSKNHVLGKLHEELVKKMGSGVPSVMYKNIFQNDKNGDGFLRGDYNITFKDKYDEELGPILGEIGATPLDARTSPEYLELIKKRDTWFAENTIDTTDEFLKEAGMKNASWLPMDKYKNPPLTGIELEVLNEFLNISKDTSEATKNKSPLMRLMKNGSQGVRYYKLPSISKSDFERQMELDFKGIVKDKFTDFTQIKVDDIGYGEAITGKGDALKNVRIHYRGKIAPNEQSRDLMTMYRLEYLNGVNYHEKSSQEANLNVIAEVAKNKKYIKKSAKTGKAMMNIFNEREKGVLFDGNLSNEYQRIVGLIESNIYDITSLHAGFNILGADVNKIISTISGYTASVAMTFNLASGTANVLNGTTQLIIESMGNQFMSRTSLLQSEKQYFADMPNILADLGKANKTSKTNQMLNMFDVFGGFSPEEQSYMKNTIAKKLMSKESMNMFNATGEHMMNAVLTGAVLANLKVMNTDHKYIDKNGNVVETKEKAASLLDMLKLDKDGVLKMDERVAHTSQNLTVNYHEGGKTHINLLIKKKSHDMFGVYDPAFQNELYKTWYGKAVMMFKKFFIAGMQARYKGLSTSAKSKDDLTDDDLTYNSALKEYEEGTYATLVRFMNQGVRPMLKNMQLSYMSEYYNEMSDYEKGNLHKVLTELITTMVLAPLMGMLLMAGADGEDDDDLLWFLIYQNQRLQSELKQFRDPREAARMITNPVAGIRMVQNALNLLGDIMSPWDYFKEDAKGKNVLVKHTKKMFPIWAQFDKDYQQMNSFLAKPTK